jgi:hypothetical protein
MLERQFDNAPELKAEPVEPSALYRDAFLRAMTHLGIPREEAASIVQAMSGRRFDECGWTELQPVVRRLQVLLEELADSSTNRRNACRP